MRQFTWKSEADALAFGTLLAKAVKPGTIIYLHGTLGAGKTTLVRGFLQGLGYSGKVKSPTYTLVEPYEVNGIPIFHFDFYRLQTANELANIGIRDYFSEEAICLIEWPEKAFPLLPAADISCVIHFKDKVHREILLDAPSGKGKAIIKQISR